jgi:glutamyl-tRNA synthetase
LRALADERGIKLKWLAQALRVALTGKTVSPGIDDVMAIIGKKNVIRKINRAIGYIKARV